MKPTSEVSIIILVSLLFLKSNVSYEFTKMARASYRRSTRLADREFIGSYCRSENGFVTFGATILLDIRLPASDQEILDDYVSNPLNILEATWEKNSVVKLEKENEFLLQFKPIQLLGFDSIAPEIVVDMIPNSILKSSVMKSKSWSLRGNSKLLSDSTFLKSFDIYVGGSISTHGAPKNSAKGFVEYKVKGKQPLMFRLTPAFIMNKVIGLIQFRVEEFAKIIFVDRFSNGFRKFSATRPLIYQASDVPL